MKFYSSDLCSFSSSLQIQPIKPSSHNSARNCLAQLNERIEHFLHFTEAKGRMLEELEELEEVEIEEGKRNA